MRKCEFEALQILRQIGKRRAFKDVFALVAISAREAPTYNGMRRTYALLEELLAIDLERK